ncbi:MAG: ATP synthase F1 subunit epsilon [Marinilabiliales bacterium]|nr:ATP synthase F1 subunit epsilon [Marinilabiliales bacterium]
MHLEIITPELKLFSGEIEMVRLPGSVGSFEILMNHAPIVSTLRAGIIKVKKADGNIVDFEIKGGVVEVVNNQVSVLVDATEDLG